MSALCKASISLLRTGLLYLGDGFQDMYSIVSGEVISSAPNGHNICKSESKEAIVT